MPMGAHEWKLTRKRTAAGLVLASLWLIITSGATALPALASFASPRSLGSNTFTTRGLVAPLSLNATLSGHDILLGWPAGQNGSGYAILGVANGSSSDCSSVTFGSIGTATSTSYTDTGRYTPQGTYYCYQVQTTYGTWTSMTGNPTAVSQIGFVASTVSLINNGNSTGCGSSSQSGLLDCGDQIVITFNRAVSTASGGSGYVCSTNTNTLMIGVTQGSGACQTTEALNVGKLVGGASNKNGRFNAGWVWSNGNKTLTVTIGLLTTGSFPRLTGTWTFNPTTDATKMLSAAGAYHICDTNSGGGNCMPTTASKE
jgi:hypothetical protein